MLIIRVCFGYKYFSQMKRSWGIEGLEMCIRGSSLIYIYIVVAVKISLGESNEAKITKVKSFNRLRHCNLVQLVCWCHDRGEFLLVYKFMPNGSLNCYLFSKRSHPLTIHGLGLEKR